VLDRILPTASPRSSLTDEALSPETGKGTEFVAVLSDEPQGGLAMRKRPAGEASYARRRDMGVEFGYASQRGRQCYGGRSLGLRFLTGELDSPAPELDKNVVASARQVGMPLPVGIMFGVD